MTAADWNFLERGFLLSPSRTERPTWDGAEVLNRALVVCEQRCRQRLVRELRVAQLDIVLEQFGGDPLRTDWRRFRPLSLAREEGWSDWLAFVLEAGEPSLIESLFGVVVAVPHVEVRREEVSAIDDEDHAKGNYRSDILMEVSPELSVHVEIKTGDPHLAKTWSEAVHLQKTHGRTWRHFLLVLPEHSADAGRVRDTIGVAAPTVTLLTWADVANAVRRQLETASSSEWKAVARTFVGALEQMLLHRPWLFERSSDACR